ncbi:hypothetical protein NLI96_g8308 [Meripilus lineatus]|uniref:DUF1295-domain-containing protein n=1 Tax=Meripilus lineatus TaxID=2056292 RepID=A0AAD5UZG5_9APHY|nr:hypothetical protein NLI96_g8308 [Physisporinus lineatus]
MAPIPELFTLFQKGITPALHYPWKVCLWASTASYVLSVITGNVSQVDRIWTFMPTIYSVYFALLPLWPRKAPLPLFPYSPPDLYQPAATNYSPRAVLMASLVFIWMCRLSYNTWRRGLFNLHDEDYRWAVLRQRVPAWFFHVTNLTFIAFAQNIILFLLGLPTHIAVFQQPATLSTSDYILTSLAIIDLLVEFTADNQQFSFQTYKQTGKINHNEWIGARIQWTPADAKRGFVTRGLWAWSRHPNFLCEQSFWIIITLFPLLAPENPSLPPFSFDNISAYWPLTPAVVLCTLFLSSTLFTESISKSKYPQGYGAYQQRVGMFVPLFTPVWGLLLGLQGKKEKVDKMLFGSDPELVPGKKEE